MNVLKWKQGNKENLIAELAKIETEEIDNESYISLNTFQEYTEKKNDRPGDDSMLRSVQRLAFLLGVIDLASASA